MRKHLCALVVCFVSFAAANDAVAGGRGEEHPYAADHIEGLPADVRRAVLSHERACGGTAAATHYFSVSISTPTQSFVSLHFENLSCPNGGTLCTRRAVSTRFMLAGTEDIGASSASMPRTSNNGGVGGLEVMRGGATRFYHWNGSGFSPARR